MASFRVGIDVVPVNRVERSLRRFGDMFVRRFFTDGELGAMPKKDALHMAGRIAAKEACMKVLGAGWPQVPWTSLEILRDATGRPVVRAGGRALATMKRLQIKEISVSLSHDGGLALAVALGVGEGQENDPGHER
ncbi:MAG TPA: holo-ACP synthase [Firmicutes bacterium]|nr:holo-ACP synthase [Candidatus Fermentithermobacillaceae bacterium]